MKVVFIVFSPSGHTLIAAQKFMHLLEDNGISCHMINITKTISIFRTSQLQKHWLMILENIIC